MRSAQRRAPSPTWHRAYLCASLLTWEKRPCTLSAIIHAWMWLTVRAAYTAVAPPASHPAMLW
eukprot:14538728-Alexandrium_andersonii.AAC.1